MKATLIGFNPNYDEDSPTLDQINNIDGYSFLEFGAPWCGHCIAAAHAIKEGLSTLNLPHIKVYDGKGKALGRAFKVKLWPTLILLKSGKEIARLVRPVDIEDIQKLLAQIER